MAYFFARAAFVIMFVVMIASFVLPIYNKASQALANPLTAATGFSSSIR
jgi:hypothetical protein